MGGIRVTVENSIGRIKQYSRMTEPYVRRAQCGDKHSQAL